MVYLEHRPSEPLASFVEMFWYARSEVSLAAPYRERVLPAGSIAVVINLQPAPLTDCGPGPNHNQMNPLPSAIVSGSRIRYNVIDSRDLRELMGIHFRPHGFSAFGVPAQEVQDRDVDLADAWGPAAVILCERLCQSGDAQKRWTLVEEFLCSRLRSQAHPAVQFALSEAQRAPAVQRVDQLARAYGLSRRRFGQIFREQVGLPPKSFLRIRRFQRALQEVRSGRDVRWAEVALDCGYFDQSHLVKEFRSFAGITPEVYSARQTKWTNHVLLAPE